MAPKPVNNQSNLSSPLLNSQPVGKNKKASDAKGIAGSPANLIQPPVPSKDFNVALSPEAKEKQAAQQKAFEIAKNTPDVREDRVSALKQKIKDGTYQPDSANIADGMMREAVMEHLATQKENE